MKPIFTLLLCLLAPLAATAQYWEGKIVYRLEVEFDLAGMASMFGGDGTVLPDSLMEKMKAERAMPDSIVMVIGQQDVKMIMWKDKPFMTMWYTSKTGKTYMVEGTSDSCMVTTKDAEWSKYKGDDQGESTPLASRDTVLGRVCSQMLAGQKGASMILSYVPGYLAVNPVLYPKLGNGMAAGLPATKAMPLRMKADLMGMMKMTMTAIRIEEGPQAAELALPAMKKLKTDKQLQKMGMEYMRIVR